MCIGISLDDSVFNFHISAFPYNPWKVITYNMSIGKIKMLSVRLSPFALQKPKCNGVVGRQRLFDCREIRSLQQQFKLAVVQLRIPIYRAESKIYITVLMVPVR